MWVQATLPFYYEDGFYLIRVHKFSDKFISTKEIQGTKKILDNERRIELSPGDLLLFNPF